MPDLPMMTLPEALTFWSRTQPNKGFIFHQDRVFTYDEVEKRVNGLAAFLQDRGLGKGSRIGCLLPRAPEYILTFLAAAKVGALVVPVNHSAAPDEIADFLERARPALLVAQDRFLGLLPRQRWQELTPEMVVVGSGDGHAAIPWSEACQPRPEGPGYTPHLGDVAYLNYTTGSSGRPKGALATHANLVWNTRAAVAAMAITGDDVHLCMFASFAHPHELFMRPLHTGGSLVLLEEINPRTIARTIREHGITCMMGLAPMYHLMNEHCAEEGIAPLRIAESGGMFTRPEINQKFRRNFGQPILSVWGSTETSGIALANRPDDFRDDGSMGKPCPHYQVRLVDEENKPVPAGEVGELTIRGEAVVAGYWEDVPFPSQEGWYQTGDVGRQDAAGFFYFLERRTGLIKVAGLKVYPLQVELQLLEHPAVREVAVIGVSDRRRGMVPKALMVLNEGDELPQHEVESFLKGRIASYMIPRQWEVVAELPKIGSGKIDKKKLLARETGKETL